MLDSPEKRFGSPTPPDRETAEAYDDAPDADAELVDLPTDEFVIVEETSDDPERIKRVKAKREARKKEEEKPETRSFSSGRESLTDSAREARKRLGRQIIISLREP